MKISKDKKYRTRDGREVVIYEIYENSEKLAAVHGAVKDSFNKWGIYCWALDGSYLREGICRLDLIEVKQKVKYIKSIKQLLEEFPDAKFDEVGYLHHPEWWYNIAPDMLEYFNGDVKKEDTSVNLDPKWVEEREES